MKRRDLLKLLKQHAFYLLRTGKHDAWSNGAINVFVPHGNELNGKTVHFILKYAGIKA